MLNLLTCYKLNWTIKILITCDNPAVIDQILVENHDFFILHLHSMPALILIVLSR